jgi:hypothetical protein
MSLSQNFDLNIESFLGSCCCPFFTPPPETDIDRNNSDHIAPMTTPVEVFFHTLAPGETGAIETP